MAAVDYLADQGWVYACDYSRAAIKRAGVQAADGGWVYPGTCRRKIVRAHQWRDESRPLRLRLPDDVVDLCDRNGNDCSQTPAQQLGDPIIRRRDGAFLII